MRQATMNGDGVTIDADEHVRQLLAVAGEASSAGDAELEGILRRHAQLAAANPGAVSGAFTIVRRDKSRFELVDVRANIRRGAQTRNRVNDLAYVNEVLRKVNAVVAQDSKTRGRPGATAAGDRAAVWGALARMQAGIFGMKARIAPVSQLDLDEELDRIDGFSDGEFE